ncbi:MAG: glycosyltransferase family 4 protein [Candidatus Andersenbacteria bacterium]
MKLLFLSALYPPVSKGGGELSTHYIAASLQQRGHQVRVITAGGADEEYNLQGVVVHRLPLSLDAKPLFERAHARKMARVLARVIGDASQYDIIHAHDFRSALALSELEYPHAVVTARDYAQVCGSTNNILSDGRRCHCSWPDVVRNHRVREAPWWRKPFRVWQYKYNINYRRLAFQKFPHQIFISRTHRSEIQQQQDLRGQVTHVIYNPVPREYLTVPAVTPPTKEILYVGTVEMYKGVGVLLEAFANIAAEFADVKLKIVGEGAQKKQYQHFVTSKGLQQRVIFSGRVAWDKIHAFYDKALVVVAPHIWIEPFGRTVVEAMARGRVVVTSNRGGPGEIVDHGVTGLLCQAGSVASLQEQLVTALNLGASDRKKIQEAAQRWVITHLDPDLIARQHETVYQAAARRASTTASL